MTNKKYKLGGIIKSWLESWGHLWGHQNSKKILQKQGVYEQKTPAKMLKNC
jgi:hypothetical protein